VFHCQPNSPAESFLFYVIIWRVNQNQGGCRKQGRRWPIRHTHTTCAASHWFVDAVLLSTGFHTHTHCHPPHSPFQRKNKFKKMSHSKVRENFSLNTPGSWGTLLHKSQPVGISCMKLQCVSNSVWPRSTGCVTSDGASHNRPLPFYLRNKQNLKHWHRRDGVLDM